MLTDIFNNYENNLVGNPRINITEFKNPLQIVYIEKTVLKSKHLEDTG